MLALGSKTYLFWLWDCHLMTSKLVPQIPEYTWNVHTKEHIWRRQKNLRAIKNAFVRAHSLCLKRFFASKPRNCQVDRKSIKKPLSELFCQIFLSSQLIYFSRTRLNKMAEFMGLKKRSKNALIIHSTDRLEVFSRSFCWRVPERSSSTLQ